MGVKVPTEEEARQKTKSWEQRLSKEHFTW